MGWLQPQTFISQSRGQGAPSKSLAGSVPARGPLPGWQMSAFCLYPLQQGALLPVFGGHEPHRGTCAHEARPPLSARPQARRHSACNDVLQSPPPSWGQCRLRGKVSYLGGRVHRTRQPCAFVASLSATNRAGRRDRNCPSPAGLRASRGREAPFSLSAVRRGRVTVTAL